MNDSDGGVHAAANAAKIADIRDERSSLLIGLVDCLPFIPCKNTFIFQNFVPKLIFGNCNGFRGDPGVPKLYDGSSFCFGRYAVDKCVFGGNCKTPGYAGVSPANL